MPAVCQKCKKELKAGWIWRASYLTWVGDQKLNIGFRPILETRYWDYCSECREYYKKWKLNKDIKRWYLLENGEYSKRKPR